jgi:CheY-like chemotaxis protein
LADGLPAIMADPDQLHQALLNLFVNARDAMPQGGVLRLSTVEVDQASVRERFPEATAGSYVRVEVADTGEGMDEETQRFVFEPFFTTKERGAGSGLGLAVVYGVVSAHRGFVELDSEQHRGTRVCLFFPAIGARPSAPPARSRARGKPRGGTETILLVEDEPMLLESVCELLEQEGYTVFAARTGEEALRIFSERAAEIGLLVTDVELPDISGWDAFRKIYERDPNVRAIMVSGYLDPPMRARMLEGGAKGFLRKPYVFEELLRTMREVLDEARAAGADQGRATASPPTPTKKKKR